MTNTKQGFAPVLAVLIILIILGGGAYLYIGSGDKGRQKAEAPAPVVATSTNPTAGWQTYRNDKYGFEFKYPGDEKISEVSNLGMLSVSVYRNADIGSRYFNVAVLPIDRKSEIVQHKNETRKEWQGNLYIFKDLRNFNQQVKTLIAGDFHAIYSTFKFIQPVSTQSSQLTFEMLKNATYSIENDCSKEVCGPVTITLKNGSYSPADRSELWLGNGLYDLFASGDMNGDGISEGAVVLRRASGASARDEIIFLFTIKDGKLQQLASTGIRTLPTTHYPNTEALDISNGILTVNALSENYFDAAQPNTKYQVKYKLVNNQLVEI